MIANILVPLDGSLLSERALPYAAALARAAGARLRLTHVMPHPPVPAHARKELDVATRLEYLARDLRAQDIQATARTIADYPPATAVIDAAAADPPADLIVMSTHGHGGIGRWLYGSVADQILSGSTIPVLLVPAAGGPAWPTDRPPRILVPLDGSTYAEAAIGPAWDLGHALGADLLFLRVVEGNPEVAWQILPMATSLAQVAPPDLTEARHYLQRVTRMPGAAVRSVETLVDSGDPTSVIPSLARQEGIDLIVMATHGRTGLARLTMGSVATTVLQRAHVPVLMVRPSELGQQERTVAGVGAANKEVWPPARSR
ncbi:MAG: universal stress protein [Chloroflexota bacterium]